MLMRHARYRSLLGMCFNWYCPPAPRRYSTQHLHFIPLPGQFQYSNDWGDWGGDMDGVWGVATNDWHECSSNGLISLFHCS